jgi:O-antigen ligase
MPPFLASIVTVVFMIWLFRRDLRKEPKMTGAIWIPTIWMLIIASRPVSWWLNLSGLPVHGAAAVEEGSPVDSLAYFFLIAAGTYVLSRRQVDVSRFVHDNAWLSVFLLYCFLAVFWSDFPFVSFKRWIKILGHPVMVLVLLTEPDAKEALVRVIKRCAYVVLPVSILWMKYYPGLGRRASDWGGMTNVGIAGAKNELGALCLMLALSLLWYLLQVMRKPKSVDRRNDMRLVFGLLLLTGYCFAKADSATSLIALVVSAGALLFLSVRRVNKRRIVGYAIMGIIIAILAQLSFDIYGAVVKQSGHDSTIEGRERLWGVLLETDTSPIFGTGFESYWLGERLQKIWAIPEFQWQPTQAHNGYLEIYLNLGVLGLLILIGLIMAVFFKGRHELLSNSEWGGLTISYLIAILAHNWTEAGFKGLSIIFLFFFIVAIKYRDVGVSSWSSLKAAEEWNGERDVMTAETGAG